MDKLNPFSNSAGDSTQNPTPLPPNPSVNMPGSGMTGGNVISGVNNITSIPPEGIGSASLGLDETPNDQSPDQKQATADQQVATATFQAEHPNRTTSSVGRGAIKLVNDEPRSNKKWLFIVLGILGVLVVIGSIVVVVMNATRQSNPIDNLSAEASFNQFANYILYGVDSTAPLEGEFDYWQDYKLDEEVAKSPIDEGWWEKAKILLERVVEKYPVVELPDSDETTAEQENTSNLSAFVHNYQQEFLNLYHFMQISSITNDELTKKFSSEGFAAVQSYIDEQFSIFNNPNTINSSEDDTAANNLDNDNSPDYIDYKKQYFSDVLGVLQLYDSYGCVVDGALADECVQNAQFNDDEKKLILNIPTTQSLVYDSSEAAANQIINKTWQLSEIVNTKADGDDR